MTKRIHHMGMVMAKAEHDRFHRSAPDLSVRQHDALLKRMGITKERDEEWHRTHLTLGEQRTPGLVRVELSEIGTAFTGWCVQQGWLVQRGPEYFATKDGLRKLADQFDIVVERTQRG